MVSFIILAATIQPLYIKKSEAATTDSKWLTYKIDGFSKDTVNQLFSVNGDAEVPQGTNFIRLTPAAALKSGAVFTKNEICPNDNYSFSTAFSFKMSNQSDNGPSDGLTFTIQAGTSSPLTNGGSLGYYGLQPSFTVKYDTFLNEGYDDPSANYIGLAQNGDPKNQAGWFTDLNQYNTSNGTNYILSNGTQYYTWIDYDGTNNNVQVLLGTSPNRESAQKILEVNNIDLGAIFGGVPIHAGFTGTTGSPNYENHDIYNWYFVNKYAPIETLNPQNNYKQAPSSLTLTTNPSDMPGEYNATVTLLDPLGNPVPEASLDTFTSTSGELTGPNGEPITDLVSDAEGKIYAVLKNTDRSKNTTLLASVGCANDSNMIAATNTNQPPTVSDDTKTTKVNTPVSGQVVGEDPDGDNLIYQEGKQPKNGTVTVNKDGTWTYTPNPDYVGDDTFTVIVDDGHGGTTESTITVHVSNNTPSLESNKLVTIQQKADTNKDANHPEEGDTLLYTIQTRNTVKDIQVKNLVIADTIPEGLEYVPGTLQVDGQPVSDTKDEDKGQYIDNVVSGMFGDVSDTEWHKVTFQVKVKSGQAGKSIENIAEVTGDNIDKPEKPSTTVQVYPLDPLGGTCGVPVALVNGSFEEPTARNPGDIGSPGAEHAWQYFYEYEVPGWKTSASDKFIQIMNSDYKYNGMDINPPHGNQYAELNAEQVSALYQDVETTPGQTLYWRLAHKGGLGVDTMAVQIGSTNIPIEELPVIQEISTGNTEWVYYSGTYTVPIGQTTTRFALNSIKAAGGDQRWGNLLDDIFLGTEACVTAEKTVSPSGDVLPGDELTYKVTVKNSGGDVAANTVIEDIIPEGTEYIPGSMEILNGPNAGNLTDIADIDQGISDGKKVTIILGDLPNTTSLPDGITIQFKVKALSGQAGKSVVNKAQVKYKDLLKNEDKELETNEVTTSIKNKDPIFKSEKSATIKEKAVGNTDQDHPEVGDTLLYTIKTKNTVTDSPIKNLVISDKLPEGLEYVADTLIVDGTLVTDTKDTDSGHFDGEIFEGHFGDVKDTDWHTLEFQVKVKSSQEGKDITNIATVSGDNVAEPDKPSNTVQVYPRPPQSPVLESKKSASIQEKANGNKDMDHSEEGDTLLYTIETRNTVENSTVTNLSISDLIPEGLEYVPGTLKVDGKAVSDDKDSDQGDFTDSKVTGNFGDVSDTEWHKITFQVKIKSGQAGKNIKNIAEVSADNITNPDKPSNTVEVYPRPPQSLVLESKKSASIQEKADGNKDMDHPEEGDTLLYTIETRNTVENSTVTNLSITDLIPEGLEYVPGTLKVDGKAVSDDKDSDQGDFTNSKVTGTFGDVSDIEWHKVTFQVKVKSGQAGKNIKNTAEVSADNITNPDEPSKTVEVYPRPPQSPVLDSKKSASIQEKADGNKDINHPEVGDIILYTIKTKNTIEDSTVKNLVISDKLPEGLEYVKGSLKVDGVSVTDEKDTDKGHYVDGIVEGQFGDVKDTNEHKLEFLVQVKAGQAGKDIKNIASVSGDNVDKPNNPEEEVNVYPRVPVLESIKTAKNLIEGKDTFEVGDTIVYTIKTHNKVSDSLVKNLVISDKIPEGLTYVSDSLKVDGKFVTDAKDSDNGHHEDGLVEGRFGDVKDTEWHTLEFLVKVKSGQEGTGIKNIANVNGDNIDQIDKPETEIKVKPKDPVIVNPRDPVM